MLQIKPGKHVLYRIRRSRRWYRSHPATWGTSYTSAIYLSALKDLLIDRSLIVVVVAALTWALVRGRQAEIDHTRQHQKNGDARGQREIHSIWFMESSIDRKFRYHLENQNQNQKPKQTKKTPTNSFRGSPKDHTRDGANDGQFLRTAYVRYRRALLPLRHNPHLTNPPWKPTALPFWRQITSN